MTTDYLGKRARLNGRVHPVSKKEEKPGPSPQEYVAEAKRSLSENPAGAKSTQPDARES